MYQRDPLLLCQLKSCADLPIFGDVVYMFKVAVFLSSFVPFLFSFIPFFLSSSLFNCLVRFWLLGNVGIIITMFLFVC